MWGWVMVQLLLVAATVEAAIATSSTASSEEDGGGGGSEEANSQSPALQVGRAIDVFTRYGYLSLSMKVVARNDSDFLFREPTVDVFTDVAHQVASTSASSPPMMRSGRDFDGDFHMEFCDNAKQLLQAYFRDFSFERLQSPWLAFTASWSPEAIARNMGIKATYVLNEHCYVLIRLARFRQRAKLGRIANIGGALNLSEAVAKEINGIRVGDVAAVFTFIRKYGSHYIESFITGNSLYQVFVFQQSTYKQIKERLKRHGIAQLNSVELDQYFSPWYAEHVGEIRVASGNRSLQRWIEANLRYQNYIFSYPTLLKVYGNRKLLVNLSELLQNEAILDMHFKTLAPAFKEPTKRRWFEEVLDNLLKLWETNL